MSLKKYRVKDMDSRSLIRYYLKWSRQALKWSYIARTGDKDHFTYGPDGSYGRVSTHSATAHTEARVAKEELKHRGYETP